jgi:hypothetical protein
MQCPRAPQSPPRRKILAWLAYWPFQIILSLVCAAVAGWFGPRIHDPGVATRLDFQAEVTLLGFLASILALSASLMVGHVLSYLQATLSEKTDLYLRFRDTLITFDDFLRNHAGISDLVNEAQSVSWELKKLRLEDFPIMDWDSRLKRLGTILEKHPREGAHVNLPLEVMAYLGFCEELISAIGLACIKQIIVRVLLQPIIKMFVVMGCIIMTLIYYCFYFAIAPLQIRLGVPVFFSLAAILLLYEVAWYFYRHIAENTDFSEPSL